MGIEALPSSAVRAIGATQVLNDPASVIKELIDNSLDAQCTSVSIEIHQNTLDSIQIRDNGHGIPPEDRLLVARPHCTSKITGEDELKDIGGTSLGFRGEALASVAEMSGSLTISTRVEGEEVATAMKISQQGEVVGQSRASLPIGTTVKIIDFIKAHPVRRQVALKSNEKTLQKIKQMLKTYAFARPHVRLSLRVLKVKNDKYSWTYAPKPGSNAEDAALKIVGASCASQCTWSVVEDEGYTVHAFLPKSTGEASNYSSIGSFISLDGRPISTARGIAKQIQKIFREALKNANGQAEGLKEPFIYLDVRCPSGSYDVNVEPAKDDALFENADVLIALIRRLFYVVYPSSSAPQSPDRSTRVEDWLSRNANHAVMDDEFVTALEPGPSEGHHHANDAHWAPLPTHGPRHGPEEQSETAPARSFRSNMYSCDEEDLDFRHDRPPTGRTEADLQELREARRDINISNPWMLAKMNAVVGRSPAPSDEDPTNGRPQQILRRDEGAGPQRHDTLPTPGPSSPIKAHGTPHIPETMTSANESGHLVTSPALPPPGPTIFPPTPFERGQLKPASDLERRSAPAYSCDPHAMQDDVGGGTSLAMIPATFPRRSRASRKSAHHVVPHPPFKPPLQQNPAREKVWFDHLENIQQPQRPRRPHQLQQSREDNGLVTQGELGDLVDDPRPLTPPRRNRDVREFFAARSADGIPITDMTESGTYPQQQRAESVAEQENVNMQNGGDQTRQRGPANGMTGFVPASEVLTTDEVDVSKATLQRANKRRKTNGKAALRELSTNVPLENASGLIEVGIDVETRAPFRRRHTTEDSPSKSRRTKSSRLPLERVPKGRETHNVTLELSTDIRDVSCVAGKIDEEGSLLAWNETSVDAYDIFATPPDEAAIQNMTTKLHGLLAVHVSEDDMAQDLEAVIRNGLAAHSQAAVESDM